MKIFPIASSSKGNSTAILSDTSSILIDAGVSMKKIIQDANLKDLDAVFLSHEHSDHIKSIGPIGRKFKCPIYMHPSVYTLKSKLFNDCDYRPMLPGDIITVKDIDIQCFSTKHDAQYTYGYNITNTTIDKTLCYLTDTGMITPLMKKYMAEADAFLIEADYDEQLLEEYEEYSDFLKDRIRSNFGHLSNVDCMECLQSVGIDNIEFVIFAHLSPRTNTPDKVMEIALNFFPGNEKKFYIAPILNDYLELK